jgi:hypothetical protein
MNIPRQSLSLKFLGLLLMSHSPCFFPLYSNLRLFFFLLGNFPLGLYLIYILVRVLPEYFFEHFFKWYTHEHFSQIHLRFTALIINLLSYFFYVLCS